MAMPRIPEVLIAAARNDYLAGASLKEIAAKHGYSVRAWAKQSASGGWEEARKMHQCAMHLPVLVRSADERAAAVDRSWRERLGGLIEGTVFIAEKVTFLLARQNLSTADFKELACLNRIMIDSMHTLQRTMEKLPVVSAEEEREEIQPGMTVEQATEIVRKKLQSAQLARYANKYRGGR